MIEDIINFLQIHPTLSTAGQPSPSQLAEVQAAGFEVVINLVPSTAPDALENERSIVTGLGMEYIHIPVIWQAPTWQDLEQFFAALLQNQKRNVFAHCVLNFRVSAFVFLYRVIHEGLPEEAARKDMLRIWEPDETWESFIKTFLSNR